MTVATLHATRPDPRSRLSVKQYHALIQAGTLTADDPVELVEGILVYKMPKNSSHATSVRRCRRAIESMLPANWFCDTQQAITLEDGEPEPDGAIVRGLIDDYAAHHPGPVDVAVVIEVADTTLARDRGIKLRSYARAGIAVCWIVNLVDRQIEVYNDPDPAATPEPRYRLRDVYAGDMVVPLVLGEQTIGTIAADALLPPV